MTARYTTSDIREITGIPVNTIDRWVESYGVTPLSGGRHCGDQRYFSLAQLIAFAVAARYRDEGAGPERVAGVLRFLAGRPLEQLENDIAAGRTLPVPGPMIGDVEWP